jgi:EAL domain-containing protein (putative c-di-GMP-specific phosphodiesterase class I)
MNNYAAGPGFPSAPATLRDRAHLVREINRLQAQNLSAAQVYLITINVADPKRYDDFIRLFGLRFTDDLLESRLADLDMVTVLPSASRIGLWSVGFIYTAHNSYESDEFLRQLVAMLRRPVICRGIAVPITAGIGVCDLKTHSGAAEDLLQSCCLAAQAGAATVKGWADCQDDERADHRRGFQLLSDAAHALAEGREFGFSYLPRISLQTWQCMTAKTQLRWHHQSLGTINQSEYMPVMQVAGIAHSLTFWMISQAIAQVARWRANGLPLNISLRLSMTALGYQNLVAHAAAEIEQAKLSAGSLELHFFEDQPTTNMGQAQEVLIELAQAKIGLAISPLSTSTAALSLLEHLPAANFTLPPSLVNALATNKRAQKIARALIDLARGLGHTIVAEGLETPKTLEMLQEWDCDYAEGPLFTRPMNVEGFLDWYQRQVK